MRRTFQGLLCCGCLLIPAALRAQEKGPEPAAESLADLETLLDQPVVTTASRAAERVQTAPSAMFTITAEDIRSFGLRSIDEALDYLGVGVRVEKVRDYYTGVDVGAQGVMLRDAGRHLLVLLDGHVMNAQADGSVSLHEGLGVPLEAIDHIEVMLGAGSVMYGANAMIAVLNVVTKDAKREQGVHGVAELSMAPPSRIDGYAKLPGGEHELGYHYRLGVGGAHSFSLGKLPGSFSARAEWQQNLSQSYAVVRFPTESFELRPGETRWGGVASHSMQVPSTVIAMRLGDFTLRVHGARYERSMPLVALFDDQRAKEVRGAARADLSHVKQLSQAFALTSRLYADYVRFSESSNWTHPWWCLPGQIDGCTFSARTVSRWLGLEQQLRYEPRADGSLSTTVGYDVRLRDASARPADYRDLISGEYPLGTRLPHFQRQSVLGAVFAQQLYRPVAWFTMNLGARLDIDSLFGAHLSPRAALVFVPHESSSLRVSYAEAFRGPSALELYVTDPTYVVEPESSLAPEIVRTVELEWQQRISFVSFSLRGYAAFYDDFIVQRPATPEEVESGIAEQELATTVDPSGVVINDNLQRIRAYGGSAMLSARPVRGLSVAGSVTLSRTESPGFDDTLWPRSFGNLRIAYEFRPGGPTLALASTLAGGRHAFVTGANADSFKGPRARPTIDLRLTLSSPVRAVEGLSVRAGAGVRVQPDSPYLITDPAVDPTIRQQYDHSLPQLHLLLGASYDY